MVDYLNEIIFIFPDPVKVMAHSFNHRFLLSAYYKQTENKKKSLLSKLKDLNSSFDYTLVVRPTIIAT